MVEGTMNIELKDDRGLTLTKKHGFTIEEADGKILAFDLMDSEDYGKVLLFGEQIFFLKFWEDEDLAKAESIVKRAIHEERLRRNVTG